ncbi:MAG: DUF1403 family protein [Mesorhizobium sp.]|nr:MAG: DUF1403 family protein [Mesorhizobium sp.]RWL90988.1 MAG: DUF1403 family protein [Mesorhizobium sp.]RWL95349.1 MAG: DUF1403 family protein [Mesorhizobium sp.]TIP45724.1 MAG: DUF1403 family protein [Mesorhizobium sp.]TJV68170.1 MAG: DUF1403 family protein [Mesorhizobium sp.]
MTNRSGKEGAKGSSASMPVSQSSARLSTREARRLFDRLRDLSAVLEPSGRSTFRLHGL